MKKIKYLLLLCVVAMSLTGCVKFNANMDIKKDKSMNFSIVYAFDKTIFGEENKLKEEDLAEAKKRGFTLTKYSEGNYEGFTLTKKIANIDDVSTDSDVIYDLSGMTNENSENKYIFKVVKGNDKNTYTAKIKFNANDSGLNSDTTEQEAPDEVESDDGTIDLTSDSNLDYSSLMQNMDLSFNVTLPNSAISSNATTKEDDNKKLSWKLGTSGEEYMEFSFDIENNASGNTILYFGVGMAVAIIVFMIAFVSSKKRKNNSDNTTTVTEAKPELKKLDIGE